MSRYSEYKKHLKMYRDYIIEMRRFFENIPKHSLNWCPICKVRSYFIIFSTEIYDYVRCAECGIVYPQLMFHPKVFNEFYKYNKIQHKIWKGELDVLREKLTTNTLPRPDYVDKILSRTKTRGKFLDIGCAFGETLHHFKPYFKSVEGVELNEFTSYEGSNLFGVTIHNKELSKANLKANSYDVIMLDNVIEHLGDMDIFKEIHRLLKVGGIVYIITPYTDSLSMRILKEKHNMFEGFEHIALFNYNAFTALAEKYNFSLDEFSTDDTLDIQLNDLLMKNSKRFIHRFNDIPFVNPLNMALFIWMAIIFSQTKYLSRHDLGSYCEVVMRKK